ncbi:MAG TPA: BsuPI-related putative proteinase inhibitor [Mycobacteriales bacterium]|nr:BsuPI-related putative proteinase inhibitor [Mycobacteriales bacterium]
MTSFGPTPRPAAQALARGARPRLADFEAALAEARRRRRRRGLQSVGAGAAVAAVVGLTGVHGALTTAGGRDPVQLVDVPAPTEDTDRVHRGTDVFDALVAAPVAAEAAEPGDATRAGSRRRTVGDPTAGEERARREPARVTRTGGPALLPSYCTAAASWCQTAGVRPAGKNQYTLSAVMCLKAGVPLGSLDYRTAQEVDFELLAGSRVIWRWSDTQSFATAAHRLSALAGDCYTWQTLWDQHDARGDRVGKARLMLRVRNTAAQAAHPAAATAVFITSP